jgi:hypothetical protein
MTGLLTVTETRVNVDLLFKRGTLHAFDSSNEKDSMLTFVNQSIQNEQQRQTLQAELPKFNDDALATALTLGLVNPNAVLPQLSMRAINGLSRLFAISKGTYRIETSIAPPAASFPLGQKWSTYVESLRRMAASDAKALLTDIAEYPISKSEGLVAIDELKLNPKELRALTYFDGAKTLGQLVRHVPVEAEVIVRTVLILRDLGLVAFAKVKRPMSVEVPAISASFAPAQPVSAPSSAGIPRPPSSSNSSTMRVLPIASSQPSRAPTAPPATLSSPAIQMTLAELKAKYAAMKKQNFFEILGLTSKSDSAAVKVAYLKLARTQHPDMLPQGTVPEIVAVQADIFSLIGDANRTLGEATSRSNYAAEIEAGTLGQKVDVSALLQAEELFVKGCIQIRARKFVEGLKTIEEAIAANDMEPEFFAWRGYAKFFVLVADRNKARIEAQKDFDLCQKHNPNIATLYYFMGHVAKVCDDPVNAKKHFQKCVSLQPNHVDAQRELRTK